MPDENEDQQKPEITFFECLSAIVDAIDKSVMQTHGRDDDLAVACDWIKQESPEDRTTEESATTDTAQA